MTDNVKFIFNTLLKVPIIIMVSFFIFNIFAVANTYLKLLGFSYVAMQVAVENNYIPETEKMTLENYLHSIETNWLEIDADWGGPRQQYGGEVHIAINGDFSIIWPLMPTEQLTDTTQNAVAGWNGASQVGEYADNDTLESRRNIHIPITVEFTVPGLKYYPDMG